MLKEIDPNAGKPSGRPNHYPPQAARKNSCDANAGDTDQPRTSADLGNGTGPVGGIKDAIEQGEKPAKKDAEFEEMLQDRTLIDTDEVNERGLMDFADLEPDPENNLLGDRWLYRGGAAIIFAPSGVGKSSAVLQASAKWGLGESEFGIQPARPLRTTILQAEDDDFDIKKVVAGFKQGVGLDQEKCERISSMVRVHRTRKTGKGFFEHALLPAMEKDKPDLVIVNPVMSFVEGNISSQEEANLMFRYRCGAVLDTYKCGLLLVNHTPKPPNTGVTRLDRYQIQYLMIGHSDLTNWARAVLAIWPVEGQEGVFQFIAAKRGAEIGWKEPVSSRENDDGEQQLRPVFTRYFRHNRNEQGVFWSEAESSEILQAGRDRRSGRPRGRIAALAFKEMLEDGMEYSRAELNRILKESGRVKSKSEEAFEKAVERLLAEMVGLNLMKSEKKGRYTTTFSATN